MNFWKIAPILPHFPTKMLPKWQFSLYPFCYGGKWPKFKKKIFVNILTLYSLNQLFVRIKNQKQFGKMSFSIFFKSNFFPNFFLQKKIQKTKIFGREK